MSRRGATTRQEPATPRRRRAPRGQGELLREEIIEATERLLVQTGDQDAVSIRAVAEAVGVTAPSIYLHFADKNELIFAVCEKHFGHFDEVMEAAGAGSGDPLEALRSRGRAYIRFGLENPEPYRIMFMSKPSHTPDSWTPERVNKSLAFEHHAAAVQRAIDAGAVEAGDPVEIAIALWAAVHGITSLFLAMPDFPWPDRETLIDRLLDVLVRGLAGAR